LKLLQRLQIGVKRVLQQFWGGGKSHTKKNKWKREEKKKDGVEERAPDEKM